MRSRFLGLLVTVVMIGAASCAYGEDRYDPVGGVPSGGDLDCADVGREVDITDGDPHGLDADGDGIGCEGY